METAGVGVPPRALLVIYSVFWTMATNVGSLLYCGYICLNYSSTLGVVAFNSFIIAVTSSIQGISAFYYLQKYLMVGVKAGWSQLVTPKQLSKAPRKSLFVWIASTVGLVSALIFQFVYLSRAESQSSTPVVLGYVIAGFNAMTFVGIMIGLLISGMFKSEDVIQEESNEMEDFSADRDLEKRPTDSSTSPRRRAKGRGSRDLNNATTLGAQLP